MAALLPPGQAVIRPMTLGVYAALERIGSPLVTGKDAKDTLDLIPSLYLLTHDPREVFRGNILDLAMRWADTQPVETVAAIKEAAFAQIRAMLDVTPEQDPDRPKKETPAGSPRRRRRGRRWTCMRAGSCYGKSRRAHSPSYSDRRKSAAKSLESSRSR